jgi:zinc protease
MRPLPALAVLPAVLLALATRPAMSETALKVAPLTLPPITERTLDNGLSVVTARRTELPLVTIRVSVPTGSARDPKGKEGLASLMSQLLRRGTATRTAEQIDDAIESMGGLLGVDAGAETTALAVTVPSEHTRAALAVVADLVRHPVFPKKDFALEKRRTLAELQQNLDDPSSVAELALGPFFYGETHPYGHPSSGRTATVSKLTHGDVVKFHARTFTPHGALLLFVGDVDAAAAEAMAGELLGDWKGVALAPVDAPPVASAAQAEILLVDKPDATQAQVRMAVPGIPRKDPRYYAATVANAIVGGGFTSRLVDEVRVNRGLSYSVSTRVSGLRSFGVVTFSTFTKNETVRDILNVSLDVLEKFRDAGPTPEELDKARRFVIGLYPARVEGSEHLAEALASARYLELPFGEIAAYRDHVAGTGASDVTAAATLFPSRRDARIVVVGPAKLLQPQLEGLGHITVRKAEEYR